MTSVEEIVQIMPSNGEMTTEKFKPKQWLLFYYNTWVRNLMARVVDLTHDQRLMAKNDAEVVLDDVDRSPISIAERIERRKQKIQDALDIVYAIQELFALDDAALEARWGEEAIKPTPINYEPMMKYKVLKDFGDVKAGEIIEVSATSPGWTAKGLKEKIDNGTLEYIPEETKQPEDGKITNGPEEQAPKDEEKKEEPVAETATDPEAK